MKCFARIVCLFIVILACSFTLARAATLFVEAESFDSTGDWCIDQQSIAAMGSPYLLAHGLGKPVADATTTLSVPDAGRYRVFARTRDWVAPWNAPGAPGRFQILLDGRPLENTLGTEGADWHWQDAGTVSLEKGDIQLALHDLTGFEGRCDAILLTDDTDFVPPEGEKLAPWRRKMLGLDGEPALQGEYDVVVVGGGVAGCCTAVSAARLGLSVALIQDRLVLGGNSSSEVRVHILGKIHREPYPILGEVVGRLNPVPPPWSPGKKETFGDDIKYRVITAEKNISLFLGEHVDEVRMKDGRIAGVVSSNIKTARRSLFQGRWFVDGTGDGAIGFLAGADYEVTEKSHLGASNMWYFEDAGRPSPFPECPWAVQVNGHPIPEERLGMWMWESGFDHDTILDAEFIRDNNFRGMYGVWSYLKNVEKTHQNDELRWAAYISGRRESRRLMGDIILTEKDIVEQIPYPDACVTTTWPIDLHYPDEKYRALSPDSPFLAVGKPRWLKKGYPIPYRCFYSRNVDNLFMAGRDISVTHRALGSPRVMATCGMMGEVVGRAAYLCKKHDAQPRDVYEKHLEDLKALLKQSLFAEEQ